MSNKLLELTEALLNSDTPISEELKKTKLELEELKKRKKIMVVEDDYASRRMMEFIFTKEHHTVISAENGKEAVEKYKQHQPKIIYMDIKMPIMNGIEATKLIRQYEKECNIEPCIINAVTGMVDEQIKCLEVGMNEVLIKPLSKDTIINTLSED